MILIDSQGYSSQAGTHVISLAVVMYVLHLCGQDASNTISCPCMPDILQIYTYCDLHVRGTH